MKTARKPKLTTIDSRYQERLTIALPRKQWEAIREACLKAQARPVEARTAFVPHFLGRLDNVLKAPPTNEHKDLGSWVGQTAYAVEGAVANWINLAEVILTFGNEAARSGGAILVPAVSQVIHRRKAVEAEDADGD